MYRIIRSRQYLARSEDLHRIGNLICSLESCFILMSGKNVKKENPSHEHIEQFLTARHYKYKSFLFLQLHVLKWNRVFHINLIKGYNSFMSSKRKVVKVCN